MTHQEIVAFVERVKPEIDEPGVYVPVVNQYLIRQAQWDGADPSNPPTRICYVMPVPEDCAIQNIGVGMLLRIANEDMGPNFIGSVHYFPEAKMLKRMKKANVPLFDNWLFHALSDFDVLGFSSYFSLQYLNIIPMLEMSGVPYRFEERIDSWEYPIIGLGGVQAYSAEAIAPAFDVYFIGEGEEMNRKFLELLREMRSQGFSKKEFLYRAAKEIQGIYLPWAYEFSYYDDSADTLHYHRIKGYQLTDEAKSHGVPFKVLKAATEFRNQKPFTKSLVSNSTGSSMTIGSLFCANSCSNLCSFCQGSQLTLPYREIPFESAKAAAKEMILNTGTDVLTPYSFNVSDLSYANRFTADILTEEHLRCILSSERLDTMDDDFVKATIKSGSRAFTVAIEGAAPRMRHVLNKNLTEEQILRAFDVMFRNGATRVKVYNISSVPFETEEDRDYYAVLFKKIVDIQKKYNNKAYIRVSFTPFNPKPHTMLQWSRFTNAIINDRGEIEYDRAFDSTMPKVYKATEDGVSFRFGTTSLVTIVAFMLNYGDRRLWPVVEAVAHDPDFKYLGGMGIGADGGEIFIKYFNQFTDLDLKYFLDERPEDEIFPWEVISNGIDKSWLLKFYKKAKAAANTPLTQEGYLRKPCYEACTYCGVCRSIDKNRGNHGDSRNDDGSINTTYWDPEIYGEGRFLPIFEYGDNSKDHIGIEAKIDEYLKPQKYKVLRFGVDINPYFRYVNGDKLKYRLRRACLRAGVPVAPKVIAASDKILMKAWFSGKELFEVYLTDLSFNLSEQEIIDRVNCEFEDGCMKIERVEKYSKAVTPLKKNFDFVLYSITLSESVYHRADCDAEIEHFNTVSDYPVKVRVIDKAKFGTFKMEVKNAKDLTYCLFTRDNQDGTWTLFAALSDILAVYDFAAVLLHTAKRNIYRYPAIVEEFLLKSTSGSAFDMFANTCLDCGEEIELNIWGESVSDQFCLKHKYLNEFTRRQVDVSDNTTEFEQETDDDLDRFNHQDVTMDDDTDLEDYVLKKSGTTSA